MYQIVFSICRRPTTRNRQSALYWRADLSAFPSCCSQTVPLLCFKLNAAESIARYDDRKIAHLEIGGDEVVDAFSAAAVHLGRNLIDPLTIAIEGPQQTRFVGLHIGLDLLERVPGHKERIFHRAVIAPEGYRVPCGIVTTACIWKGDRVIHSIQRSLPWPIHGETSAVFARSVCSAAFVRKCSGVNIAGLSVRGPPSSRDAAIGRLRRIWGRR